MGSSRGEREYRRSPYALSDGAKGEIVGTKVVAPLRDTVGFIDDEKRYLALEKLLEELTILEALRRYVQDLDLAISDHVMCFPRFGGREVGVQSYRVHAKCIELVVLILHESDQWADDKREPGLEKSWQLIDDRFAASRGHDDECVSSVHEGFDWLPLAGAKVGMAEFLRQE
jgi:hypothetical protein